MNLYYTFQHIHYVYCIRGDVLRLNEVGVGVSVIIKEIHGTGALRRRILDMGMTPNTRIIVSGTAPGGNPIEISVRGYELTMRLTDAQIIEVSYIKEG